jgi:hypothetical protein
MNSASVKKSLQYIGSADCEVEVAEKKKLVVMSIAYCSTVLVFNEMQGRERGKVVFSERRGRGGGFFR